MGCEAADRKNRAARIVLQVVRFDTPVPATYSSIKMLIRMSTLASFDALQA